MSKISQVFLLGSCLLLGGCRRDRALEDKSLGEEARARVEMENLMMTGEALTLEYKVVNPFTHDIWVCEDIDLYGRYDVETRIVGETIFVKCCFNLETNVELGEAVLARYRRVSPNSSYSEEIHVELPVRNDSPVYDFGEWGKEHRQIILHRLVLEIGCFDENLVDMISKYIEKGKQDSGNEELYVGALQLEQIQVAHPPSENIAYLYHLWSGLREERSMRIATADVDIPCSLAIDDKRLDEEK